MQQGPDGGLVRREDLDSRLRGGMLDRGEIDGGQPQQQATPTQAKPKAKRPKVKLPDFKLHYKPGHWPAMSKKKKVAMATAGLAFVTGFAAWVDSRKGRAAAASAGGDDDSGPPPPDSWAT